MATSLEARGVVPLSPCGEQGGDVDDSVLCAGGGYGGGFVYSLENLFCRSVARDIG